MIAASKSKTYCLVCNTTKHTTVNCRKQKSQRTIARAIMCFERHPNFRTMDRMQLKGIVKHISTLKHYEKQPTFTQLVHTCNTLWKTTGYEMRQANREQCIIEERVVRDNEVEPCPICLEPLAVGVPTCTTACKHTFCSSCYNTLIRQALSRHNNTGMAGIACPCCRQNAICATNR